VRGRCLVTATPPARLDTDVSPSSTLNGILPSQPFTLLPKSEPLPTSSDFPSYTVLYPSVVQAEMHLNSALLLLVQSLRVVAFTRSLRLDHTWANHQQCIDINSPATFQPLSQSSLFVNFATGGEGIVSVVVFELGDEHLGGIRAPGSNEVRGLCACDLVKNSRI